MKFLAYFLTCLLILSNTTDAEAAGGKELYTSAEEEITHYYLTDGMWELEKINRMEFVHSESREFIFVSARTKIRNLQTGGIKKENCLLSFIYENGEFHSINCF